MGRSIVTSTILAVSFPAAAVAEFRSVSLSGRVSFDAGSIFVPGVESGIGGGVGARVAFGDARGQWELRLDADLAGYVGAGDGDPILQLAGSVGRRGYLASTDDGARPYWFVGAGVGIVGIAGAGTAFPFKAGLGVSLGRGSGLDLSLFNRFTPIYGGGSPPLDFINSAGVELSLRLGH